MKMRSALHAAALVLVLAPVAQSSGLLAQDSPHGKTQRSLACADCHTQEAWRPVREPFRFDHGRDVGTALDGAHAAVTCRGCHLGWDFSEPKTAADDCSACHVDVHLGNLSGDCASCHGTDSFRDVRDETVHLATSFPLTGTHLQISCESCHVDDARGRVTSLDPECVACHRAEYENTLIDHVASGFSTDCTECHNTVSFGFGVAFDHVAVASGFPLLGAHDRLRCSACHVVPGFEPLFPAIDAQDCVGCHQADYDGEHAGSGFPTTCLSCHSVETWAGAEFREHDSLYFPIYRGAHNGRWAGCSDCHTVPADFSSFTCLTCHEHRQSAMDDKHSEIAGYTYESGNCLSCHPDGRH